MKEQRATNERPPSRTLPLLTLPVQFHGVHVSFATTQTRNTPLCMK